MLGDKDEASGIGMARELIALGFDDRYGDDLEGPSMLAYDLGWVGRDYDDEDELPPEDPRQWVIAIWLERRRQDVFLPLAISQEDWPVHGGAFDAIAEQLGWSRVVPDNLLTVGGYYTCPRNSGLHLVCWDAITGDVPFFQEYMANPVVLLPSGCADIDWKEWGLL